MTTVTEIETAIGALPAEQVRELAEWLDEYQLMLSSSAAVFRALDAEEGEGDQWLETDPPAAKSRS